MYLSMVPPAASTTSDSRVSTRFINATSRSGSSFRISEIVVKPRTSQNRMVSSRLAPPSFSRLGSRASMSTMLGAR